MEEDILNEVLFDLLGDGASSFLDENISTFNPTCDTNVNNINTNNNNISNVNTTQYFPTFTNTTTPLLSPSSSSSFLPSNENVSDHTPKNAAKDKYDK